MPTEDSRDRVEEGLRYIVPDDPNIPYDMKNLVSKVPSSQFIHYDISKFFFRYTIRWLTWVVFLRSCPTMRKTSSVPLPGWLGRTLILFALSLILLPFVRVEGKTVGVVANNPMHAAGCLDIESSIKVWPFLTICRSLFTNSWMGYLGRSFCQIPRCFWDSNHNVCGCAWVLTWNSSGCPFWQLIYPHHILTDLFQEHNGIIREGAKLLYAYAEATVPKITVITRKVGGLQEL